MQDFNDLPEKGLELAFRCGRWTFFATSSSRTSRETERAERVIRSFRVWEAAEAIRQPQPRGRAHRISYSSSLRSLFGVSTCFGFE